MAMMKLGMGDQALEYYLSICPAAKEEMIDTYRGEPYVYSQMIAGKDAATPGEAKNAWLTGTAAWTFLSVSQGFCGIQPDFTGLRLDPCIPSDWPEFTVTRKFRGATYHITVRNPDHRTKGLRSLTVDGESIEGNLIPVASAGSTVTVEASL